MNKKIVCVDIAIFNVPAADLPRKGVIPSFEKSISCKTLSKLWWMGGKHVSIYTAII
jgi:hypothetical protein